MLHLAYPVCGAKADERWLLMHPAPCTLPAPPRSVLRSYVRTYCMYVFALCSIQYSALWGAQSTLNLKPYPIRHLPSAHPLSAHHYAKMKSCLESGSGSWEGGKDEVSSAPSTSTSTSMEPHARFCPRSLARLSLRGTLEGNDQVEVQMIGNVLVKHYN